MDLEGDDSSCRWRWSRRTKTSRCRRPRRHRSRPTETPTESSTARSATPQEDEMTRNRLRCVLSRGVVLPLALIGRRLLAAAGAAVSDPVLPRRPGARQHHAGDDVGGRRSIRARRARSTSFSITQRQPGDAHAARLQGAARGRAPRRRGREAEFAKRKMEYQNANLPGSSRS